MNEQNIYEHGREKQTVKEFINRFIGQPYNIVGRADYPLPDKGENIEVWLVAATDNNGFLGILELTDNNIYLSARWMK